MTENIRSRPTSNSDFEASYEKKWLDKHTKKQRTLQELCSGVIYCRMLSHLYPAALSKKKIRKSPKSRTESAINWRLLEKAFKILKINKEIDIVEQTHPNGLGNFDFLCWFSNFYRSHRKQKIILSSLDEEKRNSHESSRDPIVCEMILDEPHIRKHGRSQRVPGDYYLRVDKEEKELLKLDELAERVNKKKKTGEEILGIFQVENEEEVTEQMVDKWKSEENDRKVTKEKTTPSIWDYSERGQPKELVDLDPKSFLNFPTENNLCFVNARMLVKICEKLPPVDFLNLSLTCRFLHWRMFAFCKCLVKKTAIVTVEDLSIRRGKKYNGKLLDIYISARQMPTTFVDRYQQRFYEELNGLRGIFVTQPAAVRKPFVFDTLEVIIDFPFFEKVDYDRCLPFLSTFRNRYRRLMILYEHDYWTAKNINYLDTNEFFKVMKPVGYRASCDWAFTLHDYDTEIFFNCSYSRQMTDVRIYFPTDRSYSNYLKFEQEYAYFCDLPVNLLVTYLANLLDNCKEFKFNALTYDPDHYDEDERDAVFEDVLYRIMNFVHKLVNGNLEEYFSSINHLFWKGKFTRNTTGGSYKFKIIKKDQHDSIVLFIGKEECFDKNEKEYYDDRSLSGEQIWKMETAVEPDDGNDAGREDQL